jgi:hypothetical protein
LERVNIQFIRHQTRPPATPIVYRLTLRIIISPLSDILRAVHAHAGEGKIAGLSVAVSGNVTQSINSWTWFFNPIGSQVGLANIELGQSSNPAIEGEVLTDVASYGKQLGRIEDALLVLLAHFRPEPH